MYGRVICASVMIQFGSKNKYWCNTHKFGIEVPKTVEDALDIDCKTGTDLWDKAIMKEIKIQNHVQEAQWCDAGADANS